MVVIERVPPRDLAARVAAVAVLSAAGANLSGLDLDGAERVMRMVMDSEILLHGGRRDAAQERDGPLPGVPEGGAAGVRNPGLCGLQEVARGRAEADVPDAPGPAAG
jgi:hypothetical protein